MKNYPEHLAALRCELLRSARARLRDADRAHEAVAETMLAALERPPQVDDPARLRAWLYGVLRHKVFDQLRYGVRDDRVGAVGDVAALEDLPQEVQAIDEPLRRAIDAQFINALDQQLKLLPPRHAEAFMMRECLGRESDEICVELGVSDGHLRVILHRARQRLREALLPFA